MAQIIAAILAIVLVVFLISINGVMVMWLWNWLIPLLFHGPTLTFFQSVGLSTLCGLLFSAKITTGDKK